MTDLLTGPDNGPNGTVLRGPDPELFRTSHYGARWYLDPLPADNVWAATTDQWPSVTTLKKAWSKPFRKKLPTGETVPLDAYWAAEFIVDNLAAVTALEEDRDAAIALICGAGKRTLKKAGDRGTRVHTVIEHLAAGHDPTPQFLEPTVAPFVPACRAFIDEMHPTWVATEFVCINRSLGYGGTADAILIVDLPDGPSTCIVDWKSRGGQHGCYEEEIAQVGGYSLAEYLIVNGPDGTPVRVPPPTFDAGLIVSLTATGYQAYPVNLDEAQEAFDQMLNTWRARREGEQAARKARQHPLIPVAGTAVPATDVTGPVLGAEPGPVTTTPPAAQIAWIKARCKKLIDDGHGPELAAQWSTRRNVPTFKQGGPTTVEHIQAITEMCDLVEKNNGLPFGPSDPTRPPATKAKARAQA